MPSLTRYRIPTVGLVLLLFVAAAAAEPRFNLPGPGTTADCRLPSIVSHEYLSATVAWEEAGHVWSDYQAVYCSGLPRDTRPSGVDHGPGAMPTVGRLPDGTVILAFYAGDALVVREETGARGWTTVLFAPLGDSSPTSPIDLWCTDDHVRPADAWLTFWAGSSSGGIHFAQRDAGGWSGLQTVPVSDTALGEMTFPQVTEHDGPDGPLPRVYFVTMAPEVALSWTDLDGSGAWSTPGVHESGPFGGDFDVARTADGYAFLTTGMQPTCPCNRVSFEEWTEAGGWSGGIDMTVDLDSFDWPQSPRVGVDADGGVHVSWYQLGSDYMMEGRHRRLHHRLREGGTWTDLDSGLADQSDAGIDAPFPMSIDEQGRAAFAWTRRDTLDGIPQPARVWISFFDYCSMSAGDPPSAGLRVVATPNPFNPATTIAVHADGDVTAIVIHDARGRRVATLTPRREDGLWKARWGGCDDAGRPLPSGLYLARARAASGAAASCKLVLSR